ncbi:MAG: hypothetical protein KC550_03720 [Nanoarchaeota archaeon]|nr:hypothetical protein [Nanoarchaeota archaeon]
MNSKEKILQKEIIIMSDDYNLELDRDIYNQAGGYGPSLIGLHQYGPSGILVPKNERLIQIGYSETSKETIKNRIKVIDSSYKNVIIPKIPGLISNLTDSKGKISSERIRYFRIRPFDDIKKILRNSIDGSLDLDGDTIRELFSNDTMNINNAYVRFYYDKGNNFLYSMRTKQNPNSQKKYKKLYDALDIDKKNLFPSFLSRVSHDPIFFWENENNIKYHEIYGQEICDLMLGDYFGFKIIDLNNSRGKERLENLAKLGTNLGVRGFNLIKKRYDDHRKRLDENRPGGIHYTFTDKGLSNFPLEVQYLDLESMIRDMFGPKKHALYTHRGKNFDKKSK